MQTKVKQVQSEAKMSLLRQNGHNEDLLESAKWNMLAMIIEVGAFAGILFVQLHHLKQSLDNKLVLWETLRSTQEPLQLKYFNIYYFYK